MRCSRPRKQPTKATRNEVKNSSHCQSTAPLETAELGEEPAQKPATGVESSHHADSQDLVDRCRAGDEAAWAEMHAKCQQHVLRQIRFTLGDQGRDQNLVEEIAARVWFGLVADNGHLLGRFQPKKGNGLEKYLGAIARFEVLRHQRSEYRRRRREQDRQSDRPDNRDDSMLREIALDVNSFLPQLTPREQEFFHHVLLGNNGHHLQISAPNAWQLKHRIRKKLLEFLEIS